MLCCRGRSDGALGLLKHSEKLIRATVDLTPLMLTHRGAKNTPQLSQHRRIVVLAKPLYETGRALDIREQKGHGPAGQPLHHPHLRRLSSTPVQTDSSYAWEPPGHPAHSAPVVRKRLLGPCGFAHRG
jgi:hypothetical protein